MASTDSNRESEEVTKEIAVVASSAKSYVERFLSDIGTRSTAQQACVGGASGWVAGYMFAKVGKMAAFTVGGVVILAQVANQRGYISINWNRVADIRREVTEEAEEKLPWLMEQMLLELDQKQKTDIAFLVEQPVEDKLGVQEAVVRKAIEALMSVLAEAARCRLTARDLVDSLLLMGATREQVEASVEQYGPLCDRLRVSRGQDKLGMAAYANLEWRVDMQLSSRALADNIEPSILLHLATTEQSPSGNDCSHLLRLSPSNLRHLVQQLETAVRSANSAHSQRVLKYVK